jgi:rubrerythrin
MSRYEEDIRRERVESEIRSSDLEKIKPNQRLFTCTKCGRLFEEKSRFCPFCSREGLTQKTMAEIKPIPEQYLKRR